MKRSINWFKKADVRFIPRNWVEKHLSEQLKKIGVQLMRFL
jgi:hypothetical protein